MNDFKFKFKSSKETINKNNSYFNYSEDKDKLCVYFHYYANENEPFYIGFGSIDRAFHFSSRNDKWRNHVKDESLVKVKIKAFDLPKEILEDLENKLINKYKPKCNISYGVGTKDLKGSKHKNSVIIQKYNLNDEFINVYFTYTDAAKSVNAKVYDIKKSINGGKPFKGYIWKLIINN